MTIFTGARGALLASAGLVLAGLAAPTMAAAPKAHAAVSADPLKGLNLDIPATTFKLPNGLTVVVHEDHSAPLVAVNIWYHVGSKNEPKGRSGFAHLFEHLMFNGSEHFNDDFFKATQKLGATQQNGTTSSDRTNYFQTVPRNALDAMLWLESDRMGHLLGAIDQAKLDEQRKVVQNEKRSGEIRPYAKAEELIIRATTPVGHPYDHSTIGSMADLDAASVDDVKDWFRTYYGPSNAVLVLAGDITVEEAKAKTQKFFGDIAPGTPVSQPKSWVTPIEKDITETAYDRVAQPRFIRVWNIADYASPDIDYLQFASYILAGDKNARLYKRLVLDEQLATAVGADVDNREIGGQFSIDATAKPGGDLKRIEAIVDEELQRFLKDGPTPAEMARIRTSKVADFARSLESIAAKAAQLAESTTLLGDANGWKAGFDRFKTASPAQLKSAATRWLAGGSYNLEILPFGNLAPSGPGVDRTAVPTPGKAVPAVFPAAERTTLANGLKLIVARRTGIPVVNMTMLFDTGVGQDFASTPPALSSIAFNLLDEATTSRSGEELVRDLGSLGARLQTGGNLETGSVSLSALKPTLPQALSLYADVILHPAFRSADVERIKAQSIAGIAAAKEDTKGIGQRLTPMFLFGADHPYGRLSTPANVAEINQNELTAFHRRWLVPNNATLIVTGDTSLAEIRPQIEQAFAGWRAGAEPQVLAPEAPRPAQPIVYLIDKPGAAQSAIRAVVAAPKRSEGDEIAREAFNTAFGGSFTSRLNMKLREEKGWAYGASSGFSGTKGARLFVGAATVQTDKTADSMSEIAKAFKSVATDKPITATELANAKDDMILGLSSAWSTGSGVGQYLADQAVSGLSDDYYAQYPANAEGETPARVNIEAGQLLADKPITWIVVGDRSKIEANVRALNLGEVRLVDADGNPAR